MAIKGISLGSKFKNFHGYDFEVTRVGSCNDIDVRFIDSGYEFNATASNIRAGKVKDILAPSVCGVGIIGEGSYLASMNKKHHKAYKKWFDMIYRCYSDSKIKRRPTYAECEVCEDWQNFQVFADWFYDNFIDGFDFDKDILNPGNKIYSPESCIFVSHEENSGFTSKSAKWKKMVNENLI